MFNAFVKPFVQVFKISSSVTYLLFDQFTDVHAGGSLNGTYATDGVNIRTVTDANSKISTTGSVLSVATGTSSGLTDGLWYPVQGRVPGKVLLTKITPSATTTSANFGWDTNTTATINDRIMFAFSAGLLYISANSAAAQEVSPFSASTLYRVSCIMRASGIFWFIKGGIHANWSLLYYSSTGSSNQYPAIGIRSTTDVFTADDVRIPSPLWLPSPIVSDGFSGATTDGLGHAEGVAGGLGGGGAGLSYTNEVGTWGVSSGKAQATSLSGGIAIEILPTTATIDVLHEALLTRSAGNIGVVVRYVDSSNYVYAVHNGTNAQLIKVVGGTPTTLVNAAATIGILRVVCYGTKFRLYCSGAMIGTEQTISNSVLQSGKVGLYTSDLNNTADNLVTYPRGSSNNEYFALDQY